MRPRPEEVIDLDRYPVHDATSPLHREFLDHCRAELSADGCCRVRFSFAPKQSRPWRRWRFGSRARSTAAPPWPIPMAATSTRAFPKTIPAAIGAGAAAASSAPTSWRKAAAGCSLWSWIVGSASTYALRMVLLTSGGDVENGVLPAGHTSGMIGDVVAAGEAVRRVVEKAVLATGKIWSFGGW